MSRKPKESTHNILFDGTKTKLLVCGSKSRIHKVISLESTRENNRQNMYFISLKTEVPLEATMHLNNKKKT